MRIATNMSWSGARYGKGRRYTVSARLNTTVAAPIPNPSDSTTVALKPGVRRTERKAYSTSCRIPDSQRAPHESRVSSATSALLPKVRRASAAASAPLSPSVSKRLASISICACNSSSSSASRFRPPKIRRMHYPLMGLVVRATARTSAFHFDCSSASCFLPFGVSR